MEVCLAKVINCILCGGAGTRLWPLSRRKFPKQFIPVFNERSLFQDTVKRNQTVSDEFLVVSNVDLHHLAQQQLTQENQNARFILEPMGRNTAAAITLSCLMLNPDDVLLVTTSDHIITKVDAYTSAVEQAVEFARKGFISTFGVQPTHPETGFGYIEHEGNDVLRFNEKPDGVTAERYLKSGCFLWNSGMFCFKVSTMLSELQKHAPKVLEMSKKAVQEIDSELDIIRIDAESMAAIPSTSIDYAVMEHSSIVKVVPCVLGWSDLGSFDAIYDEFSQSPEQNVFLKDSITPCSFRPEPWMKDSSGNLIIQSSRKIALLGVKDLLIVDTPDALMITEKGRSQQITELTQQLNTEGSSLIQTHTTTIRPWGCFENLIDEPGYKVKRIIVYPHQKLSLQRHEHRSEHWTVVSGTVWVRNGEREFELNVSESTFIEERVVHRLENRTDQNVIIIEVQTGSYTGEDDIIRIEDIYGRL